VLCTRGSAYPLKASAAGTLQTMLQVAGVDCAEEVSMIQRALKPLRGVREVRVNIMSGKAIIAHDETITPEVLIKAIGGAGLKAIREGEKADDEAQHPRRSKASIPWLDVPIEPFDPRLQSKP
jgi:copper chaperone CopZ